jgi:hypothetical protein
MDINYSDIAKTIYIHGGGDLSILWPGMPRLRLIALYHISEGETDLFIDNADRMYKLWNQHRVRMLRRARTDDELSTVFYALWPRYSQLIGKLYKSMLFAIIPNYECAYFHASVAYYKIIGFNCPYGQLEYSPLDEPEYQMEKKKAEECVQIINDMIDRELAAQEPILPTKRQRRE